ncbi:MAG: phenylalanine--tRNA ligase subunit beta [Magnetovibrio sp.]|nr:phenylalanine--tRNA ligase subunit beta [Magnetovibrio sp.]
MRFTLNWLKDHLEIDTDLEILLDRLTMIGLEVEKVTDRSRGLESFVVGLVVEAAKHPNADKLKVCMVNNGTQTFQVVCGAPNASTGMKGVFAPEGSFIPGTGIKLKKTSIREVESSGMLLSEREMGLSDEHEGIVELPDDTPIGASAAEVMGLNDPIIEIAITPNRGDCLGVRGIARDLAASGLGKLKRLDATPILGAFESPRKVEFAFTEETQSACPYFIGRTIKGVTNGDSPAWMKERLLAIGLRPISALVDITNYLTFDLCRPLHVFDLSKVVGDIHPRLARRGETITALDGKTYDLDEEICVIGDESHRAEGLGGVIGGEKSGCTESTTEVFIECAYFDPVRTAVTGRKLNIISDARYRFERGIDPAFMIDGMEIATRLVLEICGGEPSHMVIAGDEPKWQRTIKLQKKRIKTLGGVDISNGEVERILVALGFKVIEEADFFIAAVPSWRSDIVDETCLVEEVLRIYGFDKIPTIKLHNEDTLPSQALSPLGQRRNQARRALASRGMIEAVTYSFISHKDGELFSSIADSTRLINPISSDLNVMRPSLLPNLITAAARNRKRGIECSALFEIGPQFSGNKPKDQSIVAAGIRAGPLATRHWAQSVRNPDVFDAKADVIAALEEMGIRSESLQVTQEAPMYLHPGRAGVVHQGPKKMLARFGEIHPSIIIDMGLSEPVVAFEIYIDNLGIPKGKRSTARKTIKLSSFQKVERDFAFILDADIASRDVVNAVFSVDRKLITDVTVFDIYSGKNIGDGKKSLAVAITIQPEENTLNDAEIENISEQIVLTVIKKTGAILRS